MSIVPTTFRRTQPSIGLAINWLRDMSQQKGAQRNFTHSLIQQSFIATSYHLPQVESNEDIHSRDKEHLINALYDDPQTIIASASIIGELGPKGKFALYNLVHILDNSNPDVQIAGCKAIGKIGPPDAIDAIPALTRTLRVNNDKVKIAACYAIGKFGPDAVDAVPDLSQTLITSKNNGVVIAAANALNKIGPEAKDAVSDLMLAFLINNPGVKIAVSNALGEIGADARAALPVLVKDLNHKNKTVAKFVRIAFNKINSPGEAAHLC
jgi:HEAT repeat protein